MNITPEQKVKAYRILKIVVIAFVVAFFIQSFSEDRSYRKDDNSQVNTISFSGHGDVSAVPDIANVDFTIEKDAKTVKEAQDGVAQIEKKSLDFLKSNSVADKDIKTTNSSFYPKYEYQVEKQTAPCNQYSCPPTPGKNVIVGYTASESITVKIRNTDDAGKIIQGLGSVGVSNLNGPNFAVDNEDALKVQARKIAIDDAKAKAQALAKDLGVRLVKITSFSESGYNPVPMMYAKDSMMSVGAAAPAVLPKGENKINSDVTITYEIR